LEDVAALLNLSGKAALVTGGAQGLGRMIAEGLVRAGAKVYITSRKADLCESTARELSAFGRCLPLPGELATPEDVARLVKKLTESEPALHVLVNNAGRTWGAPFETFPDRAWAGVLAVNVQTPFKLVRDLLPYLKAAASAADPARVINVGSAAGLVVERINAYSYAASKAAIHHLSRVMAADLAQFNIAVNSVVPGYFPTLMTAHIRADEQLLKNVEGHVPFGRLGAPADIAGICVFLASRAAAYITGANIPVDGGLSGCR
jgi:NAD(P)-dependent dehydrogenase (short-subunit alcohol dehydrogenase family)